MHSISSRSILQMISGLTVGQPVRAERSTLSRAAGTAAARPPPPDRSPSILSPAPAWPLLVSPEVLRKIDEMTFVEPFQLKILHSIPCLFHAMPFHTTPPEAARQAKTCPQSQLLCQRLGSNSDSWIFTFKGSSSVKEVNSGSTPARQHQKESSPSEATAW